MQPEITWLKSAFIDLSYFSSEKSGHYNSIYDLTPLKWRKWTFIFYMECWWSLEITKTQLKQRKKILVFMAEMS